MITKKATAQINNTFKLDIVEVKGRSIRYHENPATLLLLADITERKEYEREREIHAQELERISVSLQQANRQVNLLSSITRHDILNQVNLGLLYLDTLIMKYEEPAIREKLEDVVSVIQTIQRQIEFTRIYEGLGMQEPQWQNLEEILSRLPVHPDISVTLQLEGVYVYADKMLEKVFYNLYDNSLRHGQGVTRIRIWFSQSAEGLVIWYEDDGAGIRDEEKEHIFERGYGENTGFGLFLVREILSLTRISIRETGVYEAGARFEIIVPDEIFRLEAKER